MVQRESVRGSPKVRIEKRRNIEFQVFLLLSNEGNDLMGEEINTLQT